MSIPLEVQHGEGVLEEEAEGDHAAEAAGEDEILQERTDAFARGAELDDGVEREVAKGYGDHSAVHAPESEGDADADDDCDTVEGVSESVIAGLTEREEHGSYGLIEERVPEAERRLPQVTMMLSRAPPARRTMKR
jgi:hypothetical protein